MTEHEFLSHGWRRTKKGNLCRDYYGLNCVVFAKDTADGERYWFALFVADSDVTYSKESFDSEPEACQGIWQHLQESELPEDADSE